MVPTSRRAMTEGVAAVGWWCGAAADRQPSTSCRGRQSARVESAVTAVPSLSLVDPDGAFAMGRVEAARAGHVGGPGVEDEDGRDEVVAEPFGRAEVDDEPVAHGHGQLAGPSHGERADLRAELGGQAGDDAGRAG